MFEFLKKLFSKKKKPKKKLGICFGSGGAKGMAHLGILRAFEEEGISFDVITGASIGSIIGAFYADGYTSKEILNQLQTINKKEFARVLLMNASMVPFQEMIESFLGEVYFNDLKKPFGCTTTNEETGETVELIDGRVSHAVTASSAIPPYFKPVKIDGVELVDGCFSNAIPSNLCRKLGADFVLAVDLSAYKPVQDKNAKKSILEQIISYDKFKDVDANTIGYDNADYMLRPDLSEYKATSINKLNEMYQVGYEYAKEEMPKIKQLLKSEGFSFTKDN